MNRRDALAHLGMLSVAPFCGVSAFVGGSRQFSSNGPSLSPTIEPTTVITIGLTVGKLFAGLFGGSSGPTIADFAQNISAQINVLDGKMTLLFNQTEEIKKILKELPTNLVSELFRLQLQSKVAIYRGIMRELNGKEYRGNIGKYMRNNTDKVRRLADQIRDDKAVLRQIHDPYLVPFIAIGVHIEYHLRFNLLPDKWPDFVGEIENDRIWLADYVFHSKNSLTNSLTALKNNRQNYIMYNSTLLVATNLLKVNMATTTRTPYVTLTKLSVENDASFKEDPDLVILRRNGVLKETETPQIFVIREAETLITSSEYAGTVLQPPGFTINTAAPMNQQLDEIAAKKLKMVADRNEELKTNYYSIVATASSYYAGLKALEFCTVYTKAANLSKNKS